MTPTEKNLLIRVARRAEERAVEEFKATDQLDVEALDTARRKRDRELGDARDMKDLVAKLARADAEKDALFSFASWIATVTTGDANALALAVISGRQWKEACQEVGSRSAVPSAFIDVPAVEKT
jgi:hypothetical protein